MSVQPTAELPAPVPLRPAPVRRVVAVGRADALLRRHGFLVFMLCAYGVALLVVSAWSAPPDTWLGVVAGREIFEHGLPHTDTLTVLGAGRDWIDQQWLAHAVFYALFAAGGMKLILFANALLGLIAAGGAMAVARRRGATVRATGWVAACSMVPFLAFAVTPRAQSFVYLLFVLVAALLMADARRPSAALVLLLPVLAVWANLHGSVVMIAVLVTGHAVFELRRRRRRLPSAIAIASWACVFASPYATELPAYYRSVLANPAFARYVTEWQATRLSLATLPVFALLAAALYMVGRSPRLLRGTELWLLAATGAAALVTLRNIIWFVLVAMMLLPSLFDGTFGPRAWSARFNRFTALAGVGIVAVAAVAVLGKPDAGRYPDAAAAAVAEAAGPRGRVYVDQLYADWLLGVDDRFEGRVAFDARYEILPVETLDEIIFLRLKAVDLERFTRTYSVFLLDRRGDAELVAALTDAGFEPRYELDDLVVLARPSAA